MHATEVPTAGTVTAPQTGAEYLESLRDDRAVFVYGERVKDVTTHPAFRNPAKMIARLYDALHDPAQAAVLTVATDTGNGGVTHPFFRVPHSVQDLVGCRDAIAAWARMSYGWMGRSPDYKAAFLGTLGANPEFYDPYGDNARRWYRESQEKVLFWNHAFVNPPVDRHLPPDQVGDVFIHAVEENASGLVLSGAKVVATGAAITQMTLVANHGVPVKDRNFSLVCTVRTDAPGVKFIARASYSMQAEVMGSPFDYPLSSRMDENDAILVFDRVLVPWENVLVFGDSDKLRTFTIDSGFQSRLTLQGCTRLAVKLDFLSGLLLKAVEFTGTGDFRGVQTRIGEVLAWRNLFWSLTEAMTRNPEAGPGGSLQPDKMASMTYRWFGMVGYPRVREIIEQDLGSALIYLNSHSADFSNPEIRPYLDKYVRGSNGHNAEERVKLMKLVWDATGTEFGSRHELYERNYQGSHEGIPLGIHAEMERCGMSGQFRAFVDVCLSEYDLDGWTSPDLISADDVSMFGPNAMGRR